MTAEQLVHLITDNFAADEEVTFLINDDQGAVRLTDAEVSNHTDHCQRPLGDEAD